ncbi:hypothetical protein E2C01_043380 [Portunus trituberculatus]|uniref:Uncharacterized protein n=1 Tax=Portunus trituberculatus TaxID=210409 RepID=A0A5B7FX63_PORTR|nr:hypothetical protein [Portunus trituberculatus]
MSRFLVQPVTANTSSAMVPPLLTATSVTAMSYLHKGKHHADQPHHMQTLNEPHLDLHITAHLVPVVRLIGPATVCTT